MKIGIYGGSFNPIHFGHIFLAEYIREELKFDKILFIPVGIPSHRENNLIDYKHRVNMIKLSIQDNKYFELCEIEKNKISFTYDTYKELKKKYPKDELYEIIGEDSAAYLYKWKDYEEMIKHVKFIVAKRSNSSYKSSEKNIIILNSPIIEISASDIRNRIKIRKSIKYYLHQDVKEYIEKNKLYY
ncbi:nicotinate-nucleotide adenylyltransferase [Hypnocyclicus thermotrophus]|uniref:Probable nicotinate-nucleotide adenylyltransferase n=1 Tax=Hypnocyclicus thermotrophus TaxID=1627895 RepID=A0AA46I5Z7_9FUSO|nr:nicotinate (nicotinamide) nucleotide adenylyltransferase [Hypnocyclicus thermotrophus]TDT71892.1 nicotinate-nucleotide adenylyltransferase [Hypnocyclicus thermotrophus]